MEYRLGEIVQTKKAHPCGCALWEIVRIGMDIKLKCRGCGRIVMLPRAQAEKRIRRRLSEPGEHVEV